MNWGPLDLQSNALPLSYTPCHTSQVQLAPLPVLPHPELPQVSLQDGLLSGLTCSTANSPPCLSRSNRFLSPTAHNLCTVSPGGGHNLGSIALRLEGSIEVFVLT